MSIATAILADSPVVYYKLDELSGSVAVDATGGGRAGTYAGGITYGIGGPEVGTTAVRFIAPNGYVIYNAQTPVLSPPWTLECWLALTARGTADQYTIANTGTPTVGAALLFQPSGINTTFNVVRSNIGFSNSGGLITDTNWHHVVWTIDASNNLSIYLDGTRVLNQAGQNVNANNSTSRWRTGTVNAGETSCAYAHTALYNVALSPAQVNVHYLAASSPPPTPPTGLSAIAVSPSQINLSWTASTGGGGVTGYSVERCAGAGCSDFSVIGTPTGTTFSDTGLVQNTTYQYRVRANSGVGFGSYSATVSATTQVLAGVSWSVDRFALNGMISPMTTQDDIIVGGTGGTAARLAKGSDGQVLTIDPTSHHLVWQTPSGGGGGGLIQLGKQTVVGSVVSSVTFSGIAGTYTQLQLAWQARGDNASNDVSLRVRLNGDLGGSSYSWQQIGSPTLQTVGSTADSAMSLALFTANNGGAGRTGQGQLFLTNYAGTVFPMKGVLGLFSEEAGSSTCFCGTYMGTWHPASPAAITSIWLFPSLGNFAIGSTFTLYGMP